MGGLPTSPTETRSRAQNTDPVGPSVAHAPLWHDGVVSEVLSWLVSDVFSASFGAQEVAIYTQLEHCEQEKSLGHTKSGEESQPLSRGTLFSKDFQGAVVHFMIVGGKVSTFGHFMSI